MAVEIIKITENYLKSSRICVEKREVVKTSENYKDALNTVTILNARNKKNNVKFITGNILQ